MVERLWAGWRIAAAEADAEAALEVPQGKTLFESLLDSGLPDTDASHASMKAG